MIPINRNYSDRRNKCIEAAAVNLSSLIEDAVYRHEQDGMAYCGSPIELLFLASWIAKARVTELLGWPYGGSYLFHADYLKESKPSPKSSLIHKDLLDSGIRCVDRLLVQPQIEDMRTDFLWMRSFHEGPDGLSVPMTSVVIECDGHDFHERTKEQASKDRDRERRLQTMGYRVFRFTGSDIWADADNCVESIELLFSKAYAEWFDENRKAVVSA